MTGKICFKCNTYKDLTEFYNHKQMVDGKLNKCKECTKKDVATNYSKNRTYYSRYDQQRYQTKERRARQLQYQINRRRNNPLKYKAWTKLNHAVRDGHIIKPDICSKCGSDRNIEGHHDDYSKPLEVKWLCFKCHRELEHNQVVTVGV